MAKVLINSTAIRKKDLVVVDGDLNVVEDALISVIDYRTGSYALIYDPNDKDLLLENPFTSDDSGQFSFWVESGIYKILALTQGEAETLQGEVVIDVGQSGGSGNWLSRDYGAIPLSSASELATTDHTSKIEQWLSKGGRCDVEAGVYVIKRPIVVSGIKTVIGQSAGVGTGGFDPDGTTTDYLELLIKESKEGSTIFYVDPAGTWNAGVDTHAITFEETRFRNLPAVSLNEFKIVSDLDTPAPVGAIKIAGAYDNNSMKNVNALFFGDSYPVIEVTKGSFEGTLGQSINWVGVNAIGAVGGTRTAPTIKLDWIQEGTLTSCKAFGSPYRVDGGGAPLYSTNDCWQVDNSRGLVFDGCSAALTQGNGFNFVATERGCIFHDLIGCTFERLGELVGTAAIKAEKSDIHAVGRITIQAPRIEVPVDRFLLTVGEVSSIRGNTIFGNCILGSGTSGCELDVDSFASVTDNSGNNSNLLRQRPNLNTSYLGHNKDIATVGPALSLRFITDTSDLNDFYRISWSASDINDFGLFSQNSRAGKSWQHLPDGKFRVNDGTDFSATVNYCDIDPTNGFIYNRTVSPSYRWVAGDSQEYTYRQTFSASTAGGVDGFSFLFDGLPGSPVMTHDPNGDLRLQRGGSETGLVIDTASGANKKITVNDANNILVNGNPITAKAEEFACMVQSTSGVVITASFQTVLFDSTAVYDDSSGSFFNGINTDRITIPSGVERIDVSALIAFKPNSVLVDENFELRIQLYESDGTTIKDIISSTAPIGPKINNPKAECGQVGFPVSVGDVVKLRFRGSPFPTAPDTYDYARLVVRRAK